MNHQRPFVNSKIDVENGWGGNTPSTRKGSKVNNMKKWTENIIETLNDKDTLERIRSYIEMYPTQKGFRLEFFMSPNFLKVIVYEMKERK